MTGFNVAKEDWVWNLGSKDVWLDHLVHILTSNVPRSSQATLITPETKNFLPSWSLLTTHETLTWSNLWDLLYIRHHDFVGKNVMNFKIRVTLHLASVSSWGKWIQYIQNVHYLYFKSMQLKGENKRNYYAGQTKLIAYDLLSTHKSNRLYLHHYKIPWSS